MEGRKPTEHAVVQSRLGQRAFLISLVVPIFNESEVIPCFYDRAVSAARSLPACRYELVFVDDGSSDDSYVRLRRLADRDPDVRVIKLSRNFGHQIAITAGLDAARGDAVIIIDGDLQDPPEVIPRLVEKWREGYDVVYGIRERREGETRFKLFTAGVFYRLLKTIGRIDMPIDVGDFRLMSRKAVKHFRRLKEKDRYVRGLVSWLGFRQAGVYYARDRRYAGKTKYPFRKMLRFALDGITSFSTVPLKLASWLGYLTSLMAFLYGCSVFIQKAMGFTVQGWATIMVAMLFMGGVQLICLGILGEYVGRIFNEMKRRPLYIVDEVYEVIGARQDREDVSLPRISAAAGEYRVPSRFQSGS